MYRSVSLGLHYDVGKPQLIHLHPTTSSNLPLTPSTITLDDSLIVSKDTIKLLRITIDQKLTFRQQTAEATWKSQSILPSLHWMAISRGASMSTLRRMVTTPLSRTLTWESEVWWTGARHITNNLIPTYLCFARLITVLPSYTKTDKLLCAAGIAPLKQLLDMKSRKYAIRLLLAKNNHPNKALLRSVTPGVRVGMGRIKALLRNLITPDSRLEHDTVPIDFMAPKDILIPLAS